MGSLSSKNSGVDYLLCMIDVFTAYVWVKSFKDKKAKTVLNGLIEIVNESKPKSNRLWVDQRMAFYNSFMQKRVDDNDNIMYSTHDESKSVIPERLINALKNKVLKKLRINDSKSCLGHMNKLADECTNNYHHSVGKKSIHTGYSALPKEMESSHKALPFKIGGRVKITKYKNIFSKGYTKHWSTEMFVIDSVFKTNPWTYRIKDLNGGKIIESFYEI